MFPTGCGGATSTHDSKESMPALMRATGSTCVSPESRTTTHRLPGAGSDRLHSTLTESLATCSVGEDGMADTYVCVQASSQRLPRLQATHMSSLRSSATYGPASRSSLPGIE